MKKLISASRRTDIPAFYSHWFMNRIRAGFCHWINPFGGRANRVSLRSEDTHGIVFWTRHPGPMLRHLDELEQRGYSFYFHVTVNGYDSRLEARNPDWRVAVAGCHKLAERIGPRRVLWRYDPIVLSDETSHAYHCARFETLARAMEGCTGRCLFSFVDLYGKTVRNLRGAQSPVREGTTEERRALALDLAQAAATHGIALSACCEDATVGGPVHKAHCVDTELLDLPPLKAAPSRAECGCMTSVDIGAYDTCQFGCLYCYATNSWTAARRRAMAHDPEDSVLWRPATLRGRNLDEIESEKNEPLLAVLET